MMPLPETPVPGAVAMVIVEVMGTFIDSMVEQVGSIIWVGICKPGCIMLTGTAAIVQTKTEEFDIFKAYLR